MIVEIFMIFIAFFAIVVTVLVRYYKGKKTVGIEDIDVNLPIVFNSQSKYTNGYAVGLEKSIRRHPTGRFIAEMIPIDVKFEEDKAKIKPLPEVQKIVE